MATAETYIEIPEGDLEEPTFRHKAVRAFITSARAFLGDNPDQPSFGKYNIIVNMRVRPDQPDHEDLDQRFGGFEVNYWLRPYGGGVKEWKAFASALGLDARTPDLEKLQNIPVIVSLKTSQGKGDNAGKTYHNVNKITLDTEA